MNWEQIIKQIEFSEMNNSNYIHSTFYTKLIFECLADGKDTVYQESFRGFYSCDYSEIFKNVKLGHLFCCEDKNGTISRCYFNYEQNTFCNVHHTSSEKYVFFRIITTSKKYLNEFKKIKDLLYEKKKNDISMLTQSKSGYEFTSIGSINCPLEEKNYTQKVLDGIDHVVEEFSSEDPNGRLVILSGEAGTGKTYLIKGIIDKMDEKNDFVFLPAKFISEIDGPSLIPLLLQRKYNSGYEFNDYDEAVEKPEKSSLIFIIEDADYCLVSRDMDNVSIISSLLNYTDGIFGSVLDIKIIATTNAHKLKFEKALLRPGRLCKHISVDRLSPEKANEIYKRLTNGDESFTFVEEATLAEIYAKARGEETFEEELEKESKVGFV